VESARLLKLLQGNSQSLFATLDGARVFDLPGILSAESVQFESLYEGGEGDELREVAPYLVALNGATVCLERLVSDGWGRSWGVYLSCNLPFDEVRHHLRKFLKVKTENGQLLYFRFYDPRVLRVFLPTCTQQQLTEFFGPIRTWWAEAAEPALCLAFGAGKAGLETEVVDLGK
jgi:hypothetical protein